MPKKLTTLEFIEKSLKKHGNKYDYSKIEYKNCNTKVKIYCKSCNDYFLQYPTYHLGGSDCPKCAYKIRQIKTRKKLSEDDLNELCNIHKNKYDYSKVDYVNSSTSLKIICPDHGEFKQTLLTHKAGHGCPKCAGLYKPTNSEIIQEFKNIHGQKYDYSKTNYKNSNSKIIIICKTHGEFKQTPHSHKNSLGCPKCVGRNKTTSEFILESNIKHDNKYDYSKTEYINSKTKVIITCRIHGDFEQSPNSHLRGQSCPHCKTSRGELKVLNYLKSKNISFKSQYKFPDCKNIRPLPFDFAILNNTDVVGLIEYNGEQHYRTINWHGSNKNDMNAFESRKLRDNIKEEYCVRKNIPLLILKYTEFNNVENLIDDFLLSIDVL